MGIDLSNLKSDESLMRQALESAGVDRWFGPGRRQCRCPFHADKHPSAGMHRDKDGLTILFTCHGCSLAGDVIRVVAVSRGVTDGDVLKHLADTGELLGGIRPGIMRAGKNTTPPRPTNYAKMARRAAKWQAAATPEWLAATAADLGVTADALTSFGWGHRDEVIPLEQPDGTRRPTHIDCAAIPMWDNFDAATPPRIAGIRMRAADGRKWSLTGGSGKGLFVPDAPPTRAAVLWVCEGATDPLAVATFGLWSVGLPASSQGIGILDAYVMAFRPTAVVCVADNNTAGKASATTAAGSLVGAVRTVKTILPPDGAKDVRAWVKAQRAAKVPDKAIRRRLLAVVRAARPVKGKAAA